MFVAGELGAGHGVAADEGEAVGGGEGEGGGDDFALGPAAVDDEGAATLPQETLPVVSLIRFSFSQ